MVRVGRATRVNGAVMTKKEEARKRREERRWRHREALLESQKDRVIEAEHQEELRRKERETAARILRQEGGEVDE